MAFLAIAQNDFNRFDPEDVKMVEEKVWWVERFIKDNMTEEENLKHLLQAMDWRKDIGLRNLSKDQFKDVIDLGNF